MYDSTKTAEGFLNCAMALYGCNVRREPPTHRSLNNTFQKRSSVFSLGRQGGEREKKGSVHPFLKAWSLDWSYVKYAALQNRFQAWWPKSEPLQWLSRARSSCVWMCKSYRLRGIPWPPHWALICVRVQTNWKQIARVNSWMSYGFLHNVFLGTIMWSQVPFVWPSYIQPQSTRCRVFIHLGLTWVDSVSFPSFIRMGVNACHVFLQLPGLPISGLCF